jgi:hypothetical protein
MSGRLLPRLALFGLVILPGCTDAPDPPAISGGRVTATSAARDTGPVTTFDGSYQGTATLNPDRSRRCPEPPPSLEATVRQGRASLVLNPATRQTLRGTVGADGSVRMVDVVDRAIMTSGIFTADTFLGTHRSGVCSYAVSLRKI